MGMLLFEPTPLSVAVRQLFASGEQGIWLDPSDFSTLFQDAAGTTPVTAVGQPVGLALDKRLGLALGAELVTNGDFSGGATGWSTFGLVTISGGAANFNAALNGANVIQAIAALSTSKFYAVTYTISSISSGSVSAAAGGTLGTKRSAPGTYTDILLPIAATVYVRARSDNTTAVINNISVREIAGNHAYQTTAASRQTAQSNYLSLDKTDDHLLVAAGGAGTTGFLLVAGIMVPAAGTARTLWSDRGTNAGYKVGIDASNQIVFSAGNGAGFVSATGPALVAGTKYVITAWHDGANLNISVNNGAPTQAAFVTATAGTATFTIGKSNGAATEYWGDRIYGMIYRNNDTSNASQRNQAFSYMVGKMGGL